MEFLIAFSGITFLLLYFASPKKENLSVRKDYFEKLERRPKSLMH